MIPSGSGSSAPFFSLPRGCSIFRPVRRGKRKKKTEKKEERKRGGGPDKVNRNKKQVASVFFRLRLLHIHEQPALDRLMPKTWNSEFNRIGTRSNDGIICVGESVSI